MPALPTIESQSDRDTPVTIPAYPEAFLTSLTVAAPSPTSQWPTGFVLNDYDPATGKLSPLSTDKKAYSIPSLTSYMDRPVVANAMGAVLDALNKLAPLLNAEQDIAAGLASINAAQSAISVAQKTVAALTTTANSIQAAINDPATQDAAKTALQTQLAAKQASIATAQATITQQQSSVTAAQTKMWNTDVPAWQAANTILGATDPNALPPQLTGQTKPSGI